MTELLKLIPPDLIILLVIAFILWLLPDPKE